MAIIEIYTSPFCGYCHRAKHLMRNKQVKFTEFNVSGSEALWDEMVKRAGGARTVPQVFIGERHIGGSDELYALDANGDLDPILVFGDQ
jgi:glutaredoxin 3